MNPLQKKYKKEIILASRSPRRKQLLRLAGFAVTVRPSDVVEDDIINDDPVETVLSLSREKAQDIAKDVKEGLVIGADTIVVLDEKILGKPKDHLEAFSMLRTLSGRTHHVYTGFALIEKPTLVSISDYEKTAVTFRELSDWEIEAYIATKSPMDKAGAYGIQDQSAVFVNHLDGCFYNVVGFPLAKFYTCFASLVL